MRHSAGVATKHIFFGMLTMDSNGFQWNTRGSTQVTIKRSEGTANLLEIKRWWQYTLVGGTQLAFKIRQTLNNRDCIVEWWGNGCWRQVWVEPYLNHPDPVQCPRLNYLLECSHRCRRHKGEMISSYSFLNNLISSLGSEWLLHL